MAAVANEGLLFLYAHGCRSSESAKENQNTSDLQPGPPSKNHPPTEWKPVSFLAPASDALVQIDAFWNGQGIYVSWR